MSGIAPLRLVLSAALLSLGTLSATTLTPSIVAAASPDIVLGPSGLPLPRFVSLKSSRVNLRIGPGRNYSVGWMYLKAGLPVEIIQEYDNWRRVRDSEGTEGWINQSLLSGKRTAIAAPWLKDKSSNISLLAEASKDAKTVAMLEPGVIGAIERCDGDWCQMSVGGHTGWISQAALWGAYPGEQIKN